MELVPIKINQGEERAWQELCGLPQAQVCKEAGVSYDQKRAAYVLHSFGMDFLVNPCKMLISCVEDSPRASLFLNKLQALFTMAVLWYMSSAKDIPLTGRLVRPIDLKGGHRFSTGTHLLPLDAIVDKYSTNREGFLNRALQYGGTEIKGYGDAYVRLYPLPRVPVDMILWLRDEEFPPKVDLLLDPTCEIHLRLSDVLWAVCMLCCVVMLE